MAGVKGMSAEKRIKYTDDYLLGILLNYQETYKDEKINIVKLAKFSNIPRNVWYRHEKIKKVIEEVNKNDITIKVQGDIDMPTARDIVESAKSDQTKLINSVQSLLDTINKLHLQETKNIELMQENALLREQNKELKRKIGSLEMKIDVEDVKNAKKLMMKL